MVLQVGLRAHQDGGLFGAPAVVEAVLHLRREPIGTGGAWGHISIFALGPLQYDVWAPLLHEGEESAVQFAALLLQHMAHHLDAGGLKLAEAVAGHQRVGVVVVADHTLDTFLDDEVSAGRCLAVVRAGLEVDV